MRVVLLIPTRTYRASDFIAAARTLGADVVVGSEEPAALAGLTGGSTLELAFDDIERSSACLGRFAKQWQIDAVVAVDQEALALAALAGERLGLPHNPVESVQVAADKGRSRMRFAACDVAQPAFRVLHADDDVASVSGAVGFPCVIKPLTSSASRGVVRADSALAACEAASRARRILGDAAAPLLVERYVPGREAAVEGLLSDGRLRVLAVFDKPDPMDGPYFQETLLVTPSRLPDPVQNRMRAVTARACEALGLREGPLHAELRVDAGEAHLLELNPRSIGGQCSRMLRFGAGASLEELVLRNTLGLPCEFPPATGAAGVLMLPIPNAGRLLGIDGRAEARSVPGIEALNITAPIGERIEPPPEGDRYLGFMFARGDTPDAVEASLRRAHARLAVTIE